LDFGLKKDRTTPALKCHPSFTKDGSFERTTPPAETPATPQPILDFRFWILDFGLKKDRTTPALKRHPSFTKDGSFERTTPSGETPATPPS
jgi:hypothetical protein